MNHRLMVLLLVLVIAVGARLFFSYRASSNSPMMFPPAPRIQSVKMAAAPLQMPATTSTAGPAPSPALTPEEVVTIQLQAMQHNDSSNTGIATAFAFASPQNRQATGPLEHFISVVNSPLYSPMLNFQTLSVGKSRITGTKAEVLAALTMPDKSTVLYDFLLEKQSADPYKGCWMTAGVARVGGNRPVDADTAGKKTDL